MIWNTPGRRFAVLLAIALLLAVALMLLATAPAAGASPSPSAGGGGGDTRGSGEGPGFVGDPLFAIVAVLGLGLASVVLTYLYVRLTAPGTRS